MRRFDLRLVILALLATACGTESARVPAYLAVEQEYVGASACVSCHEAEYELWRGSHHDLAMQEATPETVLADFDDSTFEHHGVISTFFRRGDEFWVRTDGPDGELQDYQITYTFGVDPLQQYLIEFPDGRLQALSICWDTHPESEGGQRWFHMYGDEEIPHDDILHWTGLNQNWNYMCAECHSTDLLKNYDQASDTYDTTWEEIDVACEACHGPGSRHLAWAEAVDKGEAKVDDPDGLVVQLKDEDDPAWIFDESGIARRDPVRTSNTQVESCGRCHSRRSASRDPYVHDRPLLDTHRVALLTPELYHPDGQILEEVYVYGSFLQSRMHAEGVVCSDCHESHSAELINEGDALCTKCHLPAVYQAVEHHRHKPDTPAAECVACHMRQEPYMVVDPRGDHSFRVPRPDLSLELGTPDACTDCHLENSKEWAAERFVEWWPDRAGKAHYGQAFHAALEGGEGTAPALARVASDTAQPGIVRATAIDLLSDALDSSLLGTVGQATRDQDPLVRMAAARALAAVDPENRLGMGRPLLTDEVLLVRAEAARSLSTLPAEMFSPADAAAVGSGLEDLRSIQRTNADRPESHIVLGALHAQAGALDEAVAEYEVALRLDPNSVAARLNMADVYRQMQNESRAETQLRDALRIEPENADLHHALGLSLVRQGRSDEAMAELGRAAELAPGNLRYGYVHAVSLGSSGRIPAAIRRLESLNERWPTNPDLLIGLASYYGQMGGLAEAEVYARKLVELNPRDPDAQALLQQIQSRRAGQ